MPSSGGGIISSLTGSRPTSSTQPVPSSSTAGSGSGQWGAPSSNNVNGGGNGLGGVPASNSNSLSYGSLKNRFLSGTTKNTTPTASAAGTNGAAASSSGTNSGKSKLFSLAR